MRIKNTNLQPKISQEEFAKGIGGERAYLCTEIERLFMNEIREKGFYDEGELSSDQSITIGEHSIISQYDFKVNLKELVNE